MHLESLPGLGPKSAAQLREVGIGTKQELVKLGAIAAFIKLQAAYPATSLNFLYALVGAIEDRHWREVAKEQRDILLQQLEGAQTLASMFSEKPL